MAIITVKITPTDNPELLGLQFQYSAAVVALVRGIPGAKWIPTAKSWSIPRGSLAAAMKQLAGVRVDLDSSLTRPVEPAPAEWAAPPIDKSLVEHIEQNYKFATKPFAHQKTGMALAIAARRFALLMEMGTGKTKTAIDVCNWLIEQKAIGGALVICPKAVMHSWAREIGVHSAVKRNVTVMDGSSSNKQAAMQMGLMLSQFFVTNYATLRGDVDLASLVRYRRLAIVLDESNNIANPKAQQSKEAYKLRDCTEYRFILTGTPIANSPLDAYGQFLFLDPNILGHFNFTSFKAEYTMSGGFKGKEIIAYRNLDRLQTRIAKWSYRVLKKDCLDLPDKLYRTVVIPPGPKMLEAYHQLRTEAMVEIGGNVVAAPVVLTRMMRLQQITSGFLPITDEFGKEAGRMEFEEVKLDAMEELIEEAVSQGRKVIVWSRFVHDVVRSAARCEKWGSVAYYGSISDADRQKAVDRFQTDPTCRVFCGQSHTGGIGITLTAATVEIYLSNSFSYLDRAQSEDRAHRIGQKNNVDIIDIVVKGTVDEYILSALQRKQDIAAVITGDNIKEAMGNA